MTAIDLTDPDPLSLRQIYATDSKCTKTRHTSICKIKKIRGDTSGPALNGDDKGGDMEGEGIIGRGGERRGEKGLP